jgi:NADH-quinone oxidoreductase subunit N
MNPAHVVAVGALAVLAFDLFSRPSSSSTSKPVEGDVARANALSGIRLGSVAVFALMAGLVVSRRPDSMLDDFSLFAVTFVFLAGFLVLSLSLTHFGMARSRPAEPIALVLFSLAGMASVILTDHLLGLMLAIELAWLPVVALISIDSRRLSSSESSLKAFFAHVFASIILAHGVAFVFAATGSLDLAALSQGPGERPMLFDVGVTLIVVGLLARAVVAPFHPWSPDVHEGAPSFVTAHIVMALQATTFFILLRVLHVLVPSDLSGALPGALSGGIAERLTNLFAVLGCLGLIWGHAMALVQVGLRRLVGWLGVGQAGFFALALVDATNEGGSALLLALFAAGVSAVGVLAILSSLSHHERACENVSELSGMMQENPIRAGLLALFLLSLGGFPGTIGFVARVEILSALEHGGHRILLVAGLAATVLALTAIGGPLLAMLRPSIDESLKSRALSNEQFVLALCGAAILYFGIAPVFRIEGVADVLFDSIDAAVASLRSAS